MQSRPGSASSSYQNRSSNEVFFFRPSDKPAPPPKVPPPLPPGEPPSGLPGGVDGTGAYPFTSVSMVLDRRLDDFCEAFREFCGGVLEQQTRHEKRVEQLLKQQSQEAVESFQAEAQKLLDARSKAAEGRISNALARSRASRASSSVQLGKKHSTTPTIAEDGGGPNVFVAQERSSQQMTSADAAGGTASRVSIQEPKRSEPSPRKSALRKSAVGDQEANPNSRMTVLSQAEPGNLTDGSRRLGMVKTMTGTGQRLSTMKRMSRFGTVTELQQKLRRVSAEIKYNATPEQLEQMERRNCFSKIVKNGWFDAVVASLILTNAIFIAVQTNWLVKKGSGSKMPTLYNHLNIFFTIGFSVELFLRIAAEGRKFVHGRNWRWNFLDSLIVGTAFVELILQELVVVGDGESVAGVTTFRLLRTLRLTRVIRGIRMMKFFRDLRMMVTGIISCMKALIWCVLLLVFVMFIFAVIVCEIIADDIAEAWAAGGQDLGDSWSRGEAISGTALLPPLAVHYGSVSRIIYTLFKAITGGHDWGELAEPLGRISPWLKLFFCSYIAFAVLAILNIVTGVFVENATTLAQADDENVIMEDIAERRRVMDKIKNLFNKDDHDDSGTLEWSDFKRQFEDPVVQAMFRKLDLNVEEQGIQGLFELLDFEGNGRVDIDTLVVGCTQLRGTAKSLDIAKLRHDNRRLARRVEELAANLDMETLSEPLAQSIGF